MTLFPRSPLPVLAGVLGLVLLLHPAAAAATPTPAPSPPPGARSVNPGLGQAPFDLSRATAAATWRGFLAFGEAGRFDAASHLLDLGDVPVDEQRPVGREVAEKLYRVLVRAEARPASVPDLPASPAGAGPLSVVATRLDHVGLADEVTLARVADPGGDVGIWLFNREVVSRARFWYLFLFGDVTASTAAHVNPGLGEAPPAVHRGTPHDTVAGFLAAAEAGRFDEAAHYLDLAGVAPGHQPAEGPRLARRLLLLLAVRPWVDPAAVSRNPLGAPRVGVPEGVERLATVDLRSQSVNLDLSLHLEQDGEVVWTWSRRTVQSVDLLYSEHGLGWLGDRLPPFMFSVRLGGMSLWQWSHLLFLVALGWLASRLAASLVSVILRRIAARTGETWDDLLAARALGPLTLVLWGMLLAVALPTLGPAADIQGPVGVVARLLVVLGFGWFGLRAADSFAGRLGEAKGVAIERMPFGVVPILSRFLKAAIVMVVAFGVLDVLGVNVAALLTGLGIGGIAIAFAAQKTIENLFGAASLAADRPFAVGDYVAIDGLAGTVEDIGMRSVRLRTFARTLVSIPNGLAAAARIENFQDRDRFLYNPTFGLVYATTAAQLTLVVDELKRHLLAHPRVHQEALRVRFKELASSSLNVEVVCWLLAADVHQFSALAEELNFRILEIVEAAGTSLAFPSQTLYLERSQPAGSGGREAAAAVVESRRRSGELTVPEPPPDLAERLRRQG